MAIAFVHQYLKYDEVEQRDAADSLAGRATR
jgi:hypothetical protein